MDLGIAGKTALVAASTGGLGLAVARALAAEGVRVAVVGRRRDRAKEIVAELQAAYGSGTLGIGSLGTSGFDAVAIEADLGTPEGIGSAVDQTVANLGPIDILVLNGPGPKPGAAATLTSEDMAAAFDLLVKPHHALVSKVLPGMRERRWGRILAIGSSGVTAPLPNLAVSNTGRAALAGYLKTLAAEVALDEVTVNLLLPGRIATDRVTQLDQYRSQAPRHHPAGHPVGIPQDHPRPQVWGTRRVRCRCRVPVQRAGVVHHRSRAQVRRRPHPQPLNPTT